VRIGSGPSWAHALVLPAVLMAACASDPRVVPEPPDHPLVTGGFLNIAHRGGGLLAPEETMVAYDNAVAVGADVLEMDVRVTSDGVLVLGHDNTVDRTTNGTGVLGSHTYAELLELDAGYNFTTDGGQSFPFRGQGVTIAKFRDVLEAFPTQLFSIEIKEPGITDAVVATIEETNSTDRVVVAAFSDAVVVQTRAANPNILTAMTVTESFDFVRLTPKEEDRYDPPAWILQAPPELGELMVDDALVSRANIIGIAVQVWTINDPDEARSFLDLGVGGIMTDDPAMLATILDERSTRR
jgi:glycerophosphoryl diester phosphodiesterase